MAVQLVKLQIINIVPYDKYFRLKINFVVLSDNKLTSYSSEFFFKLNFDLYFFVIQQILKEKCLQIFKEKFLKESCTLYSHVFSTMGVL